jgi:hypothetical protein
MGIFFIVFMGKKLMWAFCLSKCPAGFYALYEPSKYITKFVEGFYIPKH